MASLWFAAATLSAVAAIHRLLGVHAVHALFTTCGARTDTRQQTSFENLKRFFVPTRQFPASSNARLVTFEFGEDDVTITALAGSAWSTANVCHKTQEMCRELFIESGEWGVDGFWGGGRPGRGPPEHPGHWQDIAVLYGPARVPSRIRRFGSKRAQQLDHLVVSAVQDAEVYFGLCTTPTWLRLLYSIVSKVSARAADALARRVLWVQIRAMFYCQDTWEYCGKCRVFRVFYPFFSEPKWVRRFEAWSEKFLSREFMRFNYWVGCALLGMRPEYAEYQLAAPKRLRK